MAEKPKNTESNWTFLTNHSHVIICLAEDNAMRIRDLAVRVGITERAVQKIISELTDAGYVTINKVGRNNTYTINAGNPLKHPVESHKNVNDLINLISRVKI